MSTGRSDRTAREMPLPIWHGLIFLAFVFSGCLPATGFAQNVVTPNLHDRTPTEAQGLVAVTGLELVEEHVDSTSTIGLIFDQIPSPNTLQTAGDRVVAYISDGVAMPRLEGKTVAEAFAELTEIGVPFEVSVVAQCGDEETIVVQDP